ncbi:hypothetical protein [Oscillatoria salina]|uniref:hypothetical protein n=1 Tax=Oscillatoria salina TaxID=331517 RepID=UPI001CCA8B31|nr:hypothetical protein [Oscillatoria salina]MBZ8179636.1 hypothetical protein [Oscillatoria salina IIICB1]
MAISVFNGIFGGRIGAVLLGTLTSSITGFVVRYIAKNNPNESITIFGFLGLRGGLYVGIAIGLCFAIYGYNKSSINLSLKKVEKLREKALAILLAALLLITLFEFWGIILMIVLFSLLNYGPENSQEFLKKNVISKAKNKKWILILSGLAGAIGFKGFLGAIFGVLTGLAINRWLLPQLQNRLTKVESSEISSHEY